MVRHGLRVADGVEVPYRQLVDSTQQQFAALKRARDVRMPGPHEPRAKRVRSPRPSDRASEEPGASPWLSYDRLQEINNAGAFEPLSSATSLRIELEVARKFGDQCIDRKACAVTDAWIYRRDACCVSVEELSLAGMRKRTEHGVKVWMSRSVLQDLQTTNARLLARGCSEARLAPPRFAIADGFVAGTFDAIDAATLIKRQAVGLVQTRGLVKVVYGGPGNVLQSHLLSWDNRHATIASRAPSIPSRENFRAVLAGPMTTQQELVVAKQHECDGARVQALEALLRRINPLYRDVEESTDVRSAGARSHEVYCTRLGDGGDTSGLVAQARERQQSVAAPQDGDGQAVDETMVLQSETVVIETAVDDNEEACLSRALDAITGRPTYVARRSTSILQHDDPLYLERAYPHLLTFGVGGFSSRRSHRYSKREVVLNYLNLSSHRFAEDPLFKIQMFDYLATERVKTGVFVRVRHDPDIATRAMRVSPEELRSAMEARVARRRAAQTERSVAQGGGSGRASSVLKAINASTSKMWGSNEEREVFPCKVDAMTIMFGEPSVFWTLTPFPEGSIAVAFWSGYDLPNGRPRDLVACTVVDMPTSAEMKRLAMQNTVLQAEYYKLCCKILVDVMFGWDSSANKPKAEPGIFGFAEALFYALEQQGRLRVHIHGVLWVAGLPKTKSDWEKLLADTAIRARFEAYCESIFAAELPVFGALEEIACPRSGCDGKMDPLEIPAKYKHRLKSGTPPPESAICAACAARFTDADVVATVIERKWSALDAEHQAVSTASAVDALRLRFGGLSEHEPTAAVQLSRLLLRDQLHAFEHTSSCVKGTAGTTCWYRFFLDLESATRLREDGEVKYRRSIGNKWLNPYIPIWRRLLHFNMDARILWSGRSLQATQYASKRQSTLDNIDVMELVLRRRAEREAAAASPADRTEFQRGVGRLMSLAYSASSAIEIGGPLATAILLEGGTGRFSCKFERLVLVEGLNMLNGEDVESAVVQRGDHFVVKSSIQRYMARPRCLADCSWYDFSARFRKSSTASTAEPGDACAFSPDRVCALADNVRAHGLSRASYPSVPEIIGPRMPDARCLGDAAEQSEQAELYCRVAALLYYPFRDPRDILDANGSARAHFARWSPSSQPKLRRALEFHQQYYLSLDEARAFRAEQAASAEPSTCDDQDVLASHFEREGGAAQPRGSLLAVAADDYVCAVDPAEATAEQAVTLQTAAEVCAVQRILSNNVAHADLPEDASASVVVRAAPVAFAEIEAFERRAVAEQAQQAAGGGGSGGEAAATVSATTEVSVELLNAAVADLQFRDAAAPSAGEVEPFASVQAVSRAFGLNKQQHLAFIHIAVPLLYKIVDVDLPPQSVFRMEPLIITGAGGTGKTRIVEAVRCLAKSWCRPKSVIVTASSGIAAANLGGYTMYSAVGLGVNQKHLPSHIVNPSEKLRAKWDPVQCVIADELSMTDVGFFGLWEEALKKVKGCREPFSELLTVFIFGFCQLLAVHGTPLFKVSNPRKPFSGPQARGSLLYKAVDKVVYLTKNMRFADDPEWGEWLAKARVGEWVPGLRAFLEQVGPPPAEHLHGQFMQVVSTDNASRKRINDAAIQTASRALAGSRKVYAIPAKLSTTVSPTEMAEVANLADSQTGNIPAFLKAYVGMPVRVKANQCISKGVANGAGGRVYHIDWPAAATFSRKADEAWPTSVMPIVHAKASFKLRHTSISIRGFPVVPAFGITVHGVQGDTRDQIVVTDLRPPHCRSVDRHAQYVSLSRVQTRAGLYWLGRNPDSADFEYFGPSDDVLQEDMRLRELAALTAGRTSELQQ